MSKKLIKEVNQKLGNTGIIIKQKNSKYYFDYNGANLTGEYYSYIDDVISPSGIVMVKDLKGDKRKIDIYSYMDDREEDITESNLKSLIRKIVKENRHINESFNEKQFKDEILGDAVITLWEGFNKIETSMNYLKINGQGGTIGAFYKQFEINKLEEIISNLDKFTNR